MWLAIVRAYVLALLYFEVIRDDSSGLKLKF